MHLLYLCLVSLILQFAGWASAIPLESDVLDDASQNSDNGTRVAAHTALVKRKTASMFTIGVCRDIRVRPRGGVWKFDQAYCSRVGQLGSDQAYVVTCAASNDQANTREVEGNCPGDSKCIQQNGVNQFNEDVTDIFCVDRAQVREWTINSQWGPKPITQCTAGYNNDGQRGGTVELVTNVLDQGQHNLISPADNHFQIDGHKVGHWAANGVVDSGVIWLRAHSAVQPCVTGKVGQILRAITARIYE
ncbi:hypothetical protein CBER1_06898 [Cercospora berteroae]|uniref:Cyanovirin-N domain-containing protein n=1 Tax=Cercospora berteroae TaxID=357750 RepID=A0A2S6CI52_9PEZI|nr:hypothetical protein CBER1_06898 [Cercospora berteroae]